MSKKVYKIEGKEYEFSSENFKVCFLEKCKKEDVLKGRYETIMGSEMGVGQSTIRNWRMGINSPERLEYIIRIAEMCECDFNDLCIEKKQNIDVVTGEIEVAVTDVDNEEVDKVELIAQIKKNAEIRGSTLEELEKEMNKPIGYFERISRGKLPYKVVEQMEDLLLLRLDGTVILDVERFVRVVNQRVGPYFQDEIERSEMTKEEFICLLKNDIMAWGLGGHEVAPIKFKVVNGEPSLFTKDYVEKVIKKGS